MADAKGIRAGRAYVEVGVSDKLTAGLKKALATLKGFASGLQDLGYKVMKIGLAVAGGMAVAVKSFAHGGAALWDMSQRTGVSTEALSELSYAAHQTGSDVEGLEKGLKKMQKTLGDAQMGSDGAQETLQKLGLTVRDIQGLTPDEQFELLADRIAGVADATQRTAITLELFGRAGTSLLPMMLGGARGIRQLREEAQHLGLTVSGDTAAQAKKLDDALYDLWITAKKLYGTIGSALAPAVLGMVRWLTAVNVQTRAWLKAHKELIVTAAKLAVGVAAAGAAMYSAGRGIGLVFTAVANLRMVLGGAISMISALGSIFGVLMGPAAGITLLLIGAGIAVYKLAESWGGLGAVVGSVGGVIGGVVSWLAEQFSGLIESVRGTVTGISDALSAGDIALAAKVLWLGLKVEWQRGVNALNTVWQELKYAVVDTAAKMGYEAVSYLETAWYGMQVAWIETVSGMRELWVVFTSGLKTTWNSVQNWLAGKWLDLWELISGEDMSAARQIGDQATEDLNAQITSERDKELADLEGRRTQARGDAKRDHEGTLKAIRETYDSERRLREAAMGVAEAKTREELEAAKAELAKAVAQAKSERKELDAKGPELARRPDVSGLEEIDLNAAKASVTGAFNPWGLGQMANPALLEETKKIQRNTELAARSSWQLYRAAENGSLNLRFS